MKLYLDQIPEDHHDLNIQQRTNIKYCTVNLPRDLHKFKSRALDMRSLTISRTSKSRERPWCSWSHVTANIFKFKYFLTALYVNGHVPLRLLLIHYLSRRSKLNPHTQTQ
jgi:hypothetical protein